MSTGSLLTMVFVLALVWGGLAALLTIALRKELGKSGDSKPGGSL